MKVCPFAVGYCSEGVALDVECCFHYRTWKLYPLASLFMLTLIRMLAVAIHLEFEPELPKYPRS